MKLADKKITRKHMAYKLIYELEREYEINPNWSNQKIGELSTRLGLGRTKVYKWNWDRKKKGPPNGNLNLSRDDQQSFLAKQFFKELRKPRSDQDASK